MIRMVLPSRRWMLAVFAVSRGALLAASLGAFALAASAQPQPAAAAASAPARPTTEVRVIEDDQVRIEETRIRGQLKRIVVYPKDSRLAPYEINVGAGGRDPSQDKSGAGQRVWSVLRF
jgi:hypothetical protein